MVPIWNRGLILSMLVHLISCKLFNDMCSRHVEGFVEPMGPLYFEEEIFLLSLSTQNAMI